MPAELDILYRDNAVVVIDKPAGLLVHPGKEPEPSEQIAMKVLRDQLGQRVWSVHRLDRPTSGALLFALDPEVVKAFQRMFAEQDMDKRYTAVVLGKTAWKWTAHGALRKSEEAPLQAAETHFTREREIERDRDVFSLLEAVPKTGRQHQIRKHLANDGTPIVGDYLYGEPEVMERIAESIGQSRLMLHASRLTFEHPVDGGTVTVECPLPARFAPFLEEGDTMPGF